MRDIFIWIDVLFLVVEGGILLSSMFIITNKAKFIAWKTVIIILIGAIVYGCLVFIMKRNEVSDLGLAGIRITFFLLFSLCWFWRTPMSVKCMAVSMTLFIYLMIGNLIDIAIVLFDTGINTSIRFANLRLTYNNSLHIIRICLNSVFQTAFLIWWKDKYKKLRQIAHGYQWSIAVISVFFIILLNLFLVAANTRTRYVSDMIFMLSWTLLVLGMIFVVVFFLARIEAETAKQDSKIAQMMNHILTDSYSLLADKNDELRMQAHNFRNHLLAIQGLKEGDAQSYIKDLIQQQYKTKTVISGNRYIDAVLNSKMQLIYDNQIQFQYNIRTLGEISLSPTDLCVIVSNQIDNAIEACVKIHNPDKRWIRFLLDQRRDIITIICENSIASGSITEERLKTTSKVRDKDLHGFGIRSIEICANRNNGALVNEIDTDSFRSKVVLSSVQTK